MEAALVTFIATTTISLLTREVETDLLGDEGPESDEVRYTANPEPGGDPIPLSGIPAAITEKSRKVFDQASGELRTIRYTVGRVRADLDVKRFDRLLDERTGTVYVVDERNAPSRGLAGHLDATLDLRLPVAP